MLPPRALPAAHFDRNKVPAISGTGHYRCRISRITFTLDLFVGLAWKKGTRNAVIANKQSFTKPQPTFLDRRLSMATWR
jgi:hypothetical protein